MKTTKTNRCGFIPARVALALLTSAGVVMLYILRINMSVTIVAMVKPVPAKGDGNTGSVPKPYCLTTQDPDNINITVKEDHQEIEPLGNINITGPDDGVKNQQSDQLSLTSTERGLVLGGFFYGYFATNIPGGRLAEEYGTKKVFGGSILISGLLTLLIPVAARVHYVILILLRVVIGLVNGVVYPAMNVMIARWIPPLERNRFMSVTFMSNTLGTIIALPVCAVIAETMGWPSVFYITGGASLLWVIVWCLLMHDTPEEHPRISSEEKKYIMDAIRIENSHAKPTRTPWFSMMTSVPLWALTFAHIGSMIGFNLLLTQLPSYMDSILGFSLTSNGLLSSLPFLSQFIGSTAMGVLSDWLITKKYISVHTSRRLFCILSILLPGMLTVMVGYMGCDAILAVTLLCISSGFSGAMCSGHLANTHDLSPNFSGTLLGISNTFAYGMAMLVPVFTGAITANHLLGEWRTVFWVTGGIQAFTCLAFVIFSSTEIQLWNYGETSVVQMEDGDNNTLQDKSTSQLQKMTGATQEKKPFLPHAGDRSDE